MTSPAFPDSRPASDPRFSEDALLRSEGYSKTMEETVLPFLKSRARTCTLTGVADAPLACASFDAEHPSGTVLILHGFTENCFKFSELIFSLLHNGFSVVSYDQRGHGRSWRKPGLEDPADTHVDRFSDYVGDLKIVCDQLLSKMPKPWMIFAHSMGGAVTSLFLEQYPEVFSRAVLSSPMIAPNLGGTPAAAAVTLCRAQILAGHGAKRVFFAQPYHGPEDFATSCATDPERCAWYDAVKISRKEYQNSSPTYGWVLESIHVTRKILAAGAPEKIACPVLLFSADQDSSVMPEPQQQFIARVPRGERVFVPGSRHEIYRSTDDVLYPWWHRVLTFLKDQQS